MRAAESEPALPSDPAAPDRDPTDGLRAGLLQKQVEPFRPSFWRRQAAARLVAISAATIAGSAILFAWSVPFWYGDRREDPAPSPAQVERFAEPSIPLEESDEAATSLLASDDPVGDAITRIAAREGAPALRGVAAAADRYGVIALSTDRVVWVSRDDGRSFRQELAAPEPLGAVAVGLDGRVYAARQGGRLGVLTPGGATRWLDIDCDQVLAIDASSPWLAVLGLHSDRADGLSPILWLSGDHGRTWRRLIAPHHGDADNQVRVSTDGVVELLTADSDGDDSAARVRHYTGHVDGRPFQLASSGDELQLFGLGHDGRSWGLDWTRWGMKLVRVGVQRRDRALPLDVESWDVRLAASRDRTLAVADGQLVDVGIRRPRAIARHLPGAIDAMAVDGLGRGIAGIGSTAVRYSERHGWRALFEVPRP